MSDSPKKKFVPAAPASVVLLKRGSFGPEVVRLQEGLRDQGFYSLAVDGDFGPETAKAVIYFKQTHKGPTGDWLSNTDGADEKTTPVFWWALANATGEAQRDHLAASLTRGLSDSRKAVLKVALGEHKTGIKEIPNGSNYGDGVTKYLKGVGPAPWCCYCLSWIYHEATGGWPLGSRFGLCRAMWEQAKKDGRTYQKKPVPGDAFVILYVENGKLTGFGHIGLVGATADDWIRFSTFEGNAGNRFKAGQRAVGDNMLAGFIDLHGDADQVRNQFKRGLFRTSELVSSNFDETR